MIPDIVEIKRLCASGQWIAKVENGKILLHDTVAGETVCIGKTEAEPVRHGRWVKCQGKSNIWYCSECGEKINYKQNRRTYNIPEVPVWQKNKRCRCCGAKMDGGAEECR